MFDNTHSEMRDQSDLAAKMGEWFCELVGQSSCSNGDDSHLAAQMAVAAYAVFRGSIAGQAMLVEALNSESVDAEEVGLRVGGE